jgi:hypothetical protein
MFIAISKKQADLINTKMPPPAPAKAATVLRNTGGLSVLMAIGWRCLPPFAWFNFANCQ